MLIPPFRDRFGETWVYVLLGWGGILGAYFGALTGVKLALASTLAGFLLILPLVWYRIHHQSLSWGPIRVVFSLACVILLAAALALKLVD